MIFYLWAMLMYGLLLWFLWLTKIFSLPGLHERVNVTVVSAANCPDKIDSALHRPGSSVSFRIYAWFRYSAYLTGRFDRLLYFGTPSASDRVDISNIHALLFWCQHNRASSSLWRMHWCWYIINLQRSSNLSNWSMLFKLFCNRIFLLCFQ